MSRERKVYNKEFKLMSIALSSKHSDLSTVTEELNGSPALLCRVEKGTFCKIRE